MKLLFDQNIAHRLVQTLSGLYPGSTHVRLLNLQSASDEAVWNFAKNNGYMIISKDLDFHQRSLQKSNVYWSLIERILENSR